MKIVRTLVIAVAWLFVGTTLLTLMMVIIAGLSNPGSVSRVWAVGSGDQGHLVHIYQLPAIQVGEPPIGLSDADENLREAFWLTYRGYSGVLLAAFQAIIVTGCTILSVRGRGRLRHAAHIALCAWAALWLGNTVWMWITAPTTVTTTSTCTVAVFFACSLLRAWMSWNPHRGRVGSDWLQ